MSATLRATDAAGIMKGNVGQCQLMSSARLERRDIKAQSSSRDLGLLGFPKEKSVVLSKGSCYSQRGAWGWGSAGGEKCVGLDPWSGRLKAGLCVFPASKGLSRSIFPL